MKLSVLLSVLLIVYAAIFGVLFGSHNGIMGDLVHWDLHAKTKILNSLAILGYMSIGVGIVAVLKKSTTESNGLIYLVLLLIAFCYGFIVVDCAIFNFCRGGE